MNDVKSWLVHVLLTIVLAVQGYMVARLEVAISQVQANKEDLIAIKESRWTGGDQSTWERNEFRPLREEVHQHQRLGKHQQSTGG